MIRSYSELIKLKTFEERFEYLRLSGGVGKPTFGGARMLNQTFYRSPEWKSFHHKIVLRDSTPDYICDLGCIDHDIPPKAMVVVHHLNPITKEDILYRNPSVLDPDNVICCSLDTHNAIHYGSFDTIQDSRLITRSENDTIPWR